MLPIPSYPPAPPRPLPGSLDAPPTTPPKQPPSPLEPPAPGPAGAALDGLAGVPIPATDPAHFAVGPAASGLDLATGTARMTPALQHALNAFLQSTRARLFQQRPAAMVQAGLALRPLAAKETLDRADLLTLLKAADALSALTRTGRGGPAARCCAVLAEEIRLFVGSPQTLRTGLDRLSDELEQQASVPRFSAYMKARHPELLQFDAESGETVLNAQGRQQYEKLRARFEQACRTRHTIEPQDSHMGADEQVVSRIIGPGYVGVQRLLRHQDDEGQGGCERSRLLACAEIVQSLARVQPEEVRRRRYATVFPGGIADPRELVPGRVYCEPGFVFAGGERSSDKGFLMDLDLHKSFCVDATRYYGHQRGTPGKLQWITLPGAYFRYEGISHEHGHASYRFSQVDRMRESTRL